MNKGIQNIFYTFFTTHDKELRLLCKNIIIKNHKRTNPEQASELYYATFETIQQLLEKEHPILKDAIKKGKVENLIKRIMNLQYTWDNTNFSRNIDELYYPGIKKKVELDNETEDILCVLPNTVPEEEEEKLELKEQVYELIDDIYSYCDNKKIINAKKWDCFIFYKFFYKYKMKQAEIGRRFKIPASTVGSGIQYAKAEIMLKFKDRIEKLQELEIRSVV